MLPRAKGCSEVSEGLLIRPRGLRWVNKMEYKKHEGNYQKAEDARFRADGAARQPA